MAKPGDKYSKVNATGRDAKFQKILKHQHQQLDEAILAEKEVKAGTEARIASSEALLKSLGKPLPERKTSVVSNKKTKIKLRPWQDIVTDADASIPHEVSITDLLSDHEIVGVEQHIISLRDEFDLRHKLDYLDYGIAGIAGTLAALVDIFLVKLPSSKGLLGGKGTQGGSLSDYFRSHLKSHFSPEEISRLEKDNWVPYDASTSKNLAEKVAGLGPRSHRVQSLGHDPLLGFIFGVKDIMCGTMTAIDSNGKLITQAIPGAPTGMNIFEAVIRQIGHLKSDIGTSAGLPVPFMPLLQMLQVGSFGKKGRTVGELTRTMYAKGYDFGHFMAMSVPVIIIEVMVRTLYFLKRLHEGHSFMKSLPVNIPGQPHKPKLQTMLFIAHSIATAVNAGKVTITKNPLSINLPQWIWFAKSALHQLKWVAWSKEYERHACVQERLDTDWGHVNNALLAEWEVMESEATAE